jgi:hypothetical protein
MQDTDEINVPKCTFRLDNYLITYDHTFKTETYSCQWYYGIIFWDDQDNKYDVIHNYYLGNRLIINPKAGGFSDIPFKPATFGFLPDGIEVTEL